MSNITRTFKAFYENPLKWCNTRNYSKWNYTTYLNNRALLIYLGKNDPAHFCIDNVSQKNVGLCKMVLSKQ